MSAAEDRPMPPFALPVNVDGIPDELKAHRQFVNWRWKLVQEIDKPDRWTKVPVNSRTHNNASSTNSATWSTIDEALTAYRTHEFPGIGYALNPDDDEMFLDLDHCRDPETDRLLPWAADVLPRFANTHQEISPSATGLRIMLRGTPPGDQHVKHMGPNGQKIELFSQGKYTTLTGHRIGGTPSVVANCQPALDALYAELFPASDLVPAAFHVAASSAPLTVDDEALLAMARSASNGAKFAALFDHGDLTAHDNDDSAADFALVGYLRFWTGGDSGRMDRLFRRSKLMRDKWDQKRGEQTYGQRTIAAIIAGGGDTYAPPQPLRIVGGKGVNVIGEASGAAAAPVVWPDRQDIPPAVTVSNMPDSLIPAPLRTWMSDIAEIARLPLEMIAAPAIVGLGSVVGRSVGIRPWDYNDFTVVPNVWGCVVSRPGWMKSFAVEQGLKPIGRLAFDAHEAFEAERDKSAAKIAVIESVMDDIKRRMRDAAKKDLPLDDLEARYLGKVKEFKDASPTERRYLTHDATIEKLAELLRDNPKGMLVARDELYGLLRSFEKIGRENDRQFYLEGWSGTGSFTSDRIARGTIHVPALTLSIVGSIQPGRLRSIVDEAAAGGGADDGLMQRFQITVWPDRLEPWVKPSRWPDGDARDRAFAIYKALDGMNPYGIPAKQEQAGTIPYLKFTPLAQGVADEWHEELEHRLRSDVLDASPAFASHLAKYRSLMPSLALLFHLVEIAAGETSGGAVSEGPARLAAAWCEFLEQHARKIYDVELDRGKAAARALAAKIAVTAIIDGQTVRDIYRHQWSGLKTDEVVIDGLKILTDLGWVRLESVSTGGRASQVVRLHPVLQEGAST